MPNPNRDTFLDEIYEIANDPACFNQENGEAERGYIIKTLAIPRELVEIIPEVANANPELQRTADSIVDTLTAEFGKTETTTILALASAVSLPREILKDDIRSAGSLMVATASVAAFHLIAAEIVDDTFVQPFVQAAYSEQD